ncbi:NAD-dependent epimerase/dehydratase family protein [Actinokineospora sp. 24-640]
MRVLVVGASGFIGRHIVAHLREYGHTVTAVARTARPGVDHTVDASAVSAQTWRPLLTGHDGVVFAAGYDDSGKPPRRPSYRRYHQGNVASVVALMGAARAEGVSAAVVLGSYFTHFHRQMPELRLADRHPYVRSREEQAVRARAAAGPDLPVTVLDLPFVFGRVGNHLPIWSPGLIDYARSSAPLFAPKGGTAGVTATHVAEQTLRHLQDPAGTDIALAEANLTWKALLAQIAAATGNPRRVRHLPAPLVWTLLTLASATHRLTGREPGLTASAMPDLLLRDLFITPAVPRDLGDVITDMAATP